LISKDYLELVNDTAILKWDYYAKEVAVEASESSRGLSSNASGDHEHSNAATSVIFKGDIKDETFR
jgi:hypothetical protein